MNIKGIENLTVADLRHEVERGGKFVIYQYCFSILVMTFRRSSGVYFVRGGQSRLMPGLPWSLITLLFGWWGFPWGFIWSPMCIYNNLSGGKDVTASIMGSLGGGSPMAAPPPRPPPMPPPPPMPQTGF